MGIDLHKAATETLRWYILQTLDAGRPYPVSEDLIIATLNGPDFPPITQTELRRELDYLRDRRLVELTGTDDERWLASLTRLGVDIVEYTVDVQPGIARPVKR